jgi:hypothetical protein
MNKKAVVWIGLLLLVALALASCGEGVRIGELQTRSETVARDGADAVEVNINMGAGVLEVSGGADELLEASFTTNVAELEPEVTYAGGVLSVQSSSVTIRPASLLDIGDFRNEWDLRLNEETPLAMVVEGGAGRSQLELGTLTLTQLDVNGGAGEVKVDLAGSQALRRLSFDGGAGPATIDLSGEWGTDLDAVVIVAGPPVVAGAGVEQGAGVADGDEDFGAGGAAEGLAAADGGEVAAAGGVGLVVEGEQVGLDADVLDVDGVAGDDVVFAGVFEGEAGGGGVEDQGVVAAADVVAAVGGADDFVGGGAEAEQGGVPRLVGGHAGHGGPVPAVDLVGAGEARQAAVGEEGVEVGGRLSSVGP